MSAISSRNRVPPWACSSRPGRIVAFGLAAEQLLLDPLGAHHRRRQDDERRPGARAPLVDHPRGDFLADPGRTGDQHPAAGRRDALQGRANGVDRDRAAVELVLLPDLLAQRRILAPQPIGLGGAVDEVDQPLGLERLLDEVDRPFPHRGDGGVEVAVARDHQHRDGRIAALDLLQQLQPVEPRSLQPDVEQHHRRAPLLDRVERGGAVGRGAHRIALVLEHAADQVADVGLIVHYQHFKRHQLLPRRLHCLARLVLRLDRSRAPQAWRYRTRSGRGCPPPGRSRKAISPICSSTIFLTIASPRPVPRTRVVMYGSVSRSRSSGRPTPVSSTSMTRCAVLVVKRQLDAIAGKAVLAATASCFQWLRRHS